MDARQELATRTAQIQELVLAYSELEQESEARLGQVQLLGRLWSETVSASSLALRTLWQHLATPGTVDQQLVRKAVMSAVVQQEEAQKVLARAGLQQLAAGAASAAADSSALLQTLDTLPDPLRQQERTMFASAIRELHGALAAATADKQAAEQEAESANARLASALSDLSEASRRESAASSAAGEARAALADADVALREQRERVAALSAAAASAPPAYENVLVDGRLWSAADVAELRSTADDLRRQCDELRASVAEAAAASAAATVSAAVAELEASPSATAAFGNGGGGAHHLSRHRSPLAATPAPPAGSRAHSRDLAASSSGLSALRGGGSPLLGASSSSSFAAGGGGSGDPANSTTAALVAAISQESSQYLTRAVAAEALLAEATADRDARESEHAAALSEARSRAAAAESTAGLLTRTAASLRHELQLAQDKYAAQAGVVEMLRQELADAHARLGSLQAAKSEMARKAAAALREVEGQVAALTGAVQQMKQQHGQPGQAPGPR
jgi:hypothetical protein